MYFMKVISTTVMRKNIAEIVDEVKINNQVFAVGRRNKPEVLVIKFPENLNKKLTTITNVNANSESFNFLESEPDIYQVADLKKKYV